MSLGIVTYGGVTYNDIGFGRYIASTAEIGTPRDELKISGGSFAKKATPPTVNAGCTRIVEYPVTTNPLDPEATLVNRRLNITVAFQAEPGLTMADIKGELVFLNTFLTEDMIRQIMSGAS